MTQIRMSTPDLHVFNFFPNNEDQINFKVKAANNANILLTSDPKDEDPRWLIVLGGDKNSKLFIKKNGKDVATTPSNDLLSDKEYRQFWIKWKNGTIQVGKNEETNEIASYKESDQMKIEYIGFCTSSGATGNWIVKQKRCGCKARRTGPKNQGDPTLNWATIKKGEEPPRGYAAGDLNGNPLYVMRSNFVVPGYLEKGSKHAHAVWNGTLYCFGEYEVLTRLKGSWVTTKTGELPPGALAGGKNAKGEPLFIGKVDYQGKCLIGSVSPKEGLVVAFENEKLTFSHFEILVQQ